MLLISKNINLRFFQIQLRITGVSEKTPTVQLDISSPLFHLCIKISVSLSNISLPERGIMASGIIMVEAPRRRRAREDARVISYRGSMFEFKRCYGRSTEPFAVIAVPVRYVRTANARIDAR